MKKHILLLLFFSSQSMAGEKTLRYAPSVVKVTGKLDLQTFPGPPGFESIKNGDDAERHFYLKLDTPFDVQPSKEDEGVENAEEEKNVRILQLSISEENDKLWSRFRKLGKGGHVSIEGTLFHRFTGHHHSRVLLIVRKMEPLLR